MSWWWWVVAGAPALILTSARAYVEWQACAIIDVLGDGRERSVVELVAEWPERIKLGAAHVACAQLQEQGQVRSRVVRGRSYYRITRDGETRRHRWWRKLAQKEKQWSGGLVDGTGGA